MSKLTPEQIRSFNKDGFLVVDLELGQELLEAAKNDAIAFYDIPSSTGQFRPGSRAQDAWQQSDSIKDVALNRNALHFLKQLFGAKPRPFQTLNFPVGTQQKLHSDTIHFNSKPSGFMAGIWVALEDITSENGPLVYYPGSHKLPEYSMQDFGLDKGYSNYKHYEVEIEKKVKESGITPKFALMKKGQAMIWHANLIHGGSKRKDSSTSRHSQVTHYYFEGCRYYTPMESTESDLAWREPRWIEKELTILPSLLKKILSSKGYHQLKKLIKPVKNKLDNRVNQVRKAKSHLPILFVHTPKTAGTSFRQATLKSKLIDEVICDYGKDNPTTSDNLRIAYYHQNGDNKMQELLSQERNFLATGHFSVDRYSKYFYPYQIGIFMRDPVERIISNFYHKERHDQFDGSIEEFVKSTTNLQCRFFGSLPIEFFGFVGISEKYEQSIDLINKIYNLDLKVFHQNSNPNKKTDAYNESNELVQQIESANAKEVQTYKSASRLFEIRLNQGDSKFPLYGSWKITSDNVIKGRAYRAFTEQPVALCLYIDDELIAQTSAVEHDPIPAHVKQPRDGYIGFEFDIREIKKAYSNIKILSSDTMEPLINMSEIT